MDDIEAQIKFESSRAAQLSREATKSLKAGNWQQGRALMKEAVAASKNCQKLIEQLNESSKTVTQSEKA
jgi:hypothetical protein